MEVFAGQVDGIDVDIPSLVLAVQGLFNLLCNDCYCCLYSIGIWVDIASTNGILL